VELAERNHDSWQDGTVDLDSGGGLLHRPTCYLTDPKNGPELGARQRRRSRLVWPAGDCGMG
jgi:hypothetical protein